MSRRFARTCATGAGPLGPWTGEDLQSYRKDEDVYVGTKETILYLRKKSTLEKKINKNKKKKKNFIDDNDEDITS